MARAKWRELADRLGLDPAEKPGGEGVWVQAEPPLGPWFDLADILMVALDQVAEPATAASLVSSFSGEILDDDPDLWTHAKTGNQYALLTDTARLEWLGMESPPYCVYTDAETGNTWIRPREEFFGPGADGAPRFTL